MNLRRAHIRRIVLGASAAVLASVTAFAGTASAQAESTSQSVGDAFLGATAGITAAVESAADQLPGSAGREELSQVDALDLDRYVGTWYQVAAVPQIFTIQCASDTTAEYAALDASTVSVRNSCTDVLGGNSVVTGRARVVDAATNASLRVAFDGLPGQNSDGPTNYRVTYIDEDYGLAIVGDPARRSGFVLSRTAAITAEQWGTVRDIVADRGYQPCTFVTTPQSEGRGDITPLCAL